MINIIKLFLEILDKRQKKQFILYVFLLFIGSVSSVFGIGAVIPFISVLLQPDKLTAYPMISGYSYHSIVLALAVILILAFWLKNI